MPLAFNKVRGKPSRMLLRRIGTLTVAPSTVTATLSAGASAGATSLTVAALSAAIPKNTILVFSRAAGTPSTVTLVVTADADASDTTLAVDTLHGALGEGLPYSLAISDAAIWDGLYTDFASNALDFAANEQVNELAPVTHGSGSGVRVSEPEVVGISPTISRQGLFLNKSQVLTDLVKNVQSPNSYWWGKLVVPDEDGEPLFTYAGLGKVSGVGHPSPADGLIGLSYNFRFVRDDFTITEAT